MIIPKNKFMEEAILEAKKAPSEGENYMFGAIIVKDEKIIGRGHNCVNKNNDPTCHGEMTAIRDACKKLGTKDLNGCTIYSTCEPCPMCFAACWWANISNLVFGVKLESSKSREIDVSSKYLNERGNSKLYIISGFMEEECKKLYS